MTDVFSSKTTGKGNYSLHEILLGSFCLTENIHRLNGFDKLEEKRYDSPLNFEYDSTLRV